MATRQKKKVITNVTPDQASDSSRLYAEAYTSKKKIEAKMNEEINKVKAKYQEDITDLDEQMKEQYEYLNVFAAEQKENWGKKKSLEMLHTIIGFRTGTPKIKCDKGFNWTSVTELLKEHFPDYVRTVSEPNKEKLIADREEEGFDKVCKKAHIEVVQDETFFVEPKVEELQPA
jgi:phage host-nuclease inhibitor protein Gam